MLHSKNLQSRARWEVGAHFTRGNAMAKSGSRKKNSSGVKRRTPVIRRKRPVGASVNEVPVSKSGVPVRVEAAPAASQSSDASFTGDVSSTEGARETPSASTGLAVPASLAANNASVAVAANATPPVEPAAVVAVSALAVSDEGAAVFEYVLSQAMQSAGSAVASGMRAFRKAGSIGEMCGLLVRQRVDRKTLLTLQASMDAPLNSRDAKAIREQMEKDDVPVDKQLRVLNALNNSEVPEYRAKMQTIEAIFHNIDATRTMLRLVEFRFGNDLAARYDEFSLELDKIFVPTNQSLLKQLNDFLFEFGDRLVDADITSLAGFAKLALDVAKKLWSRGDQREAFLKAVRSSIQYQLDPINIGAPGLTLNIIADRYRGAPNAARISDDECRAIYLLVQTILRERSDNTEFHNVLERHGLREYARLHGKLLELNVKLMGAAII